MIIKRSNNYGMSSIVFAIAFVTILSLLAVGFATIARRDTNEVLDRTLSYQAQYAAESGINKAIKQIKAGTTSQTDCTNPSASFNLSPGVDITCVTWGPADDNNVVLSGIKEYPKNIRLQSADLSKSIDKINIEWSYADAVVGTPNGIKPSIDGKNILKIALAKPGVQTNNLMYANATNSPGTTTTNLQDGASFDVNCTGNSCSLDINSLGGNTWFLALSSLGKDVSRATITAYNGSNQLNLADVQIEIDSNAIANGVTKRLLARVPLESSSWIPANAVTANRICKDIRIDGNNNTNISGFNYTNPLFGCPDTVNVPPDPPGDVNVVDIGGGGGSGGNSAGDDATVGTQTGTPGKPGSSKIYPYWSFYPSILNSTIPDAQRDYCTWQVVYSSKSNASFAEMEKVGGLITDTGAQCYNGVTKSFTAGNSTSKGAPKCNIAKCNRAGYYNAEFYLYAKDGRVVGPRYRTTGLGAPANYCRPFIFDKGREVCQANP